VLGQISLSCRARRTASAMLRGELPIIEPLSDHEREVLEHVSVMLSGAAWSGTAGGAGGWAGGGQIGLQQMPVAATT
jgi:hypothetical protein